ncbi:hypothetical protein PENSPDRAFT_281836 [Peniophora sp. CONT]|nr:hypothetical protein PENSPDRAFT_281836 [Peniophora sp. CONT]
MDAALQLLCHSLSAAPIPIALSCSGRGVYSEIPKPLGFALGRHTSSLLDSSNRESYYRVSYIVTKEGLHRRARIAA